MNIKEVLELHKEYLETNGIKGTRANLSGADLYGANLSGANLYGADLSGANLYGADLSRANLSGADLSRANLSGANLSGANLSGANLYGADLSRANLSGANLSGADLSGADLSRANLSRANLSRANLYVTNFHGYTVTATSKDMKIGCEFHTWAEWKKDGQAIARKHHGLECGKEFKEFWPIFEAARKMLQKRFPVKKESKP